MEGEDEPVVLLDEIHVERKGGFNKVSSVEYLRDREEFEGK